MAARKRSSRKQGNPNNPNTVLVLFMVFFILLSIGLGVGTYYGYAGQKKLEDDAIGARKEAKAARNASEYYKFQALAARGAEGPLFKDDKTDEANDLAVLMDEFETQSKFKDEATRPAVAELVVRLKKELVWNPAEKKYSTTWSKKFEKQEAELKRVQADYGTVMAEKKATEEKLRGLQTKYEKDWDAAKASIDKGNAETLAAAKAKTKEMNDAFNENQALSAKLEKAQSELEKVKRLNSKTVLEKNTTIAELIDKVALLNRKLEQQAQAQAVATASLMVGDFAGKWTGTLARGGAVDLDIKADGTAIWSVPGITKETITGVSHLEKAGENYVVSIQNQPVRLYLASDRRTLRLTGAVEATLNRK